MFTRDISCRMNHSLVQRELCRQREARIYRCHLVSMKIQSCWFVALILRVTLDYTPPFNVFIFQISVNSFHELFSLVLSGLKDIQAEANLYIQAKYTVDISVVWPSRYVSVAKWSRMTSDIEDLMKTWRCSDWYQRNLFMLHHVCCKGEIRSTRIGTRSGLP